MKQIERTEMISAGANSITQFISDFSSRVSEQLTDEGLMMDVPEDENEYVSVLFSLKNWRQASKNLTMVAEFIAALADDGVVPIVIGDKEVTDHAGKMKLGREWLQHIEYQTTWTNEEFLAAIKSANPSQEACDAISYTLKRNGEAYMAEAEKLLAEVDNRKGAKQ